MGRHGLRWQTDDLQWTRDRYADLDWPPPLPRRRGRRVLLLALAFVAAVTAVIAGTRLVTAHQTPASGTGLSLAPACPAGLTCATFNPPPVPTSTAVAGVSPSADPPTALPSPDVTGGHTAKATPAATSHRDSVSTAQAGNDDKTAKKATKAAAPTHTARAGTATAPKRVVVKYTVLSENAERYSAQIAIGNNGDGDLNGLEISMPVGGRVFAVEGARAIQQGQTLILQTTDLLPSGGGIAVTIAVNGASVSPGTCTLAGGSCDIL